MINTKHPDYKNYEIKAVALQEGLKQELAEADEIEQSDEIIGLDGLRPKICKKYSQKLNELMQEYSYLRVDTSI